MSSLRPELLPQPMPGIPPPRGIFERLLDHKGEFGQKWRMLVRKNQGFPEPQIAREFNIAAGTVSEIALRARKKLGFKSLAEVPPELFAIYGPELWPPDEANPGNDRPGFPPKAGIFEPVTDQHWRVLIRKVQGFHGREIARELNIAYRTVGKYASLGAEELGFSSIWPARWLIISTHAPALWPTDEADTGRTPGPETAP